MAPTMTPPPTAPTFLKLHGWAGAEILPLAGDASFRRYFRVVLDGRTAVLMDAPPQHEDSRPFLAVAGHLLARGFAAPKLLAVDLDEGLILLEDFGDDRMREVILADPAREEGIYEQAIDLLLGLHEHDCGELPPYDRAVLHREVGLFPEWYAPALGLTVDGPGFVAAWEQVFALLDEAPPVTVLRDYHAENIMILPDGTLGLLDFQDALAGHPGYDLVSVLQDARRDVAPDLELRMLDRYRARRPLDLAAYAVLGAQRNTKILGIFTRLWRRDGKDRYLSFQPRMWGLLERDLAHPALAPVAEWFARNVPQPARAAPWAAYAGEGVAA